MTHTLHAIGQTFLSFYNNPNDIRPTFFHKSMEKRLILPQTFEEWATAVANKKATSYYHFCHGDSSSFVFFNDSQKIPVKISDVKTVLENRPPFRLVFTESCNSAVGELPDAFVKDDFENNIFVGSILHEEEIEAVQWGEFFKAVVDGNPDKPIWDYWLEAPKGTARWEPILLGSKSQTIKQEKKEKLIMQQYTVYLTPKKKRYDIEVTVLNEVNHEPVENAHVELNTTTSSYTNAEGRVLFPQVIEGSYNLVVSHDDFEVKETTIQVPKLA